MVYLLDWAVHPPRNYSDMSKAGAMSADAAEENVRAVYESFLKKYPESTTTDYIGIWMARNEVGD